MYNRVFKQPDKEKSLSSMIISAQDVANEFQGSFSMKNAAKKYFFVNETWLDYMQTDRSKAIGKTDEEFFTGESLEIIRKTDQEVYDDQILIVKINRAAVGGKEISYIALKWAIRHGNGELFAYCTLWDLLENKDHVLAIIPKVNELFGLRTHLYKVCCRDNYEAYGKLTG